MEDESYQNIFGCSANLLQCSHSHWVDSGDDTDEKDTEKGIIYGMYLGDDVAYPQT